MRAADGCHRHVPNSGTHDPFGSRGHRAKTPDLEVSRASRREVRFGDPSAPGSGRCLPRLPSTSDPPLTPLSPRHSHPACAQRVAGVRFGRGHFRYDLREKKAPSMTRDAFDRFDLGRNPRRPLERPLYPRTSPRDFAIAPTSPTSHHPRPFVRNGPYGLGPPVTSRRACMRARGRGASWDHDVVVRSLQQKRDVDTFARSSFLEFSRAVSDVRGHERCACPCGLRTGRDHRVEESRPERLDRAPARRISSTRCHRHSRARPGEDASPSCRPRAHVPIDDPAKDRRRPMSQGAFRRRHGPDTRIAPRAKPAGLSR